MDKIDLYIMSIMEKIHAPVGEKQRIAAELRSHFDAAQEAGEAAEAAIARMGSSEEVAVAYMRQINLKMAGFWPRLAAFIVDLLVLFVVAGVLAILAVIFSNQVPQHPQGLDYVTGALWILLTLMSAGGVLGLILLYFPVLEARFGQTAGKRLLRLRVLKENGLPIGYKEAFLRRLSFYFEILPVDALFIPFTERKQRAFDIVARTVVVKEFD
jgi:uncharacterized RDD family membrane protein YckC